MTAQNIIDATLPVLTGLKVADLGDPADYSTLLHFLNLGKNQIALDTLYWKNGETILMTTANEYTLTNIPIQIVDVYDSDELCRPRNSSHPCGYYQTAPDTIFVNAPTDGSTLYVNYYMTPDDYIISDTVNIPHGLINALEYFIAHKAFDMYKGDSEIMMSKEYYNKYEIAMAKFKAQTDNNNLDTLLSNDMIAEKGLV